MHLSVAKRTQVGWRFVATIRGEPMVTIPKNKVAPDLDHSDLGYRRVGDPPHHRSKELLSRIDTYEPRLQCTDIFVIFFKFAKQGIYRPIELRYYNMCSR